MPGFTEPPPEPLPESVLPLEPPEPLEELEETIGMVFTLFSVAARLRLVLLSVPVARARSFTPLMFAVV